MAKPWDTSMKLLIRSNPRAFVLITNPRILEELTTKVGLAKTPEEAREYLLRWRKPSRGPK